MVRRMLIGAVALIALVAAPAAADYGVTVSPGQVEPGGAVTVSGHECNPGSEVTITMAPVSATKAAGDPVTVATTTADENGNWSVTFNVPAGFGVGSYTVNAYCDGQQVASEVIEVVNPGTATTSPGTNGEPIVRTGSDLNGLGLLGAGLLTAGGLVLVATRTRRHRANA